MTLPAPNLDDRRFQELVDEAKKYVMRHCPDWTDHNVSDPGITMIETFAYMTDGLYYRLNQVPDRLYIRFLELIGLKLLPATPARCGVTFWLSSPAQTPIVIPVGTRTGTLRTEVDEPVVFATTDDLAIVPCATAEIATQGCSDPGRSEAKRINRTEALKFGRPFPAFSPVPAAGDSLLVALTEAVPRCAVMLQFVCTIEGVGVDPTKPPLVWEAWDGAAWTPCDVGSDETGGLNRNGAVVVHVPETHVQASLDGISAGWLRARVVPPEEDQPEYTSSPMIHGLTAATVGGTVTSVHADVVAGEVLGMSEGVPGQRFPVGRAPMVAGPAPTVVEVSSNGEWLQWNEVPHFAASGPEDRHVSIDHVGGEVQFGPLVRQADGTARQYGAVPLPGATVRLRSYAIGGGSRGNVGRGTIRTLKSSIPYVSAVENRYPAVAGIEAETIEEAKERGPIFLRTRSRAVTAEDFEQLTRQAAPEVARVRCVGATNGPDAGGVRVLIVPAAPMERGIIRFEDLEPSADVLRRIAEQLDRVRLIGTRVTIEPPAYQPVTVVAMLRAAPNVSPVRIRDEATERLGRYFNPICGGPHGDGWPWGRPVQAGDAFGVLQGLPGVDLVEEVLLFGANLATRERGEPTQRVVLDPDSLVFSFQHQIRVKGAS
jgi:predicted phage baseplate assembly protein